MAASNRIKAPIHGRIQTILIALAVILLACAGYVTAAEPGSKDDPLATISYVKQYAQFVEVLLPPNESLRLGQGTEFLIIDAQDSVVHAQEFDPLRDELIDMTGGAPVLGQELAVYHHYLNASNHDIFLRMAGETRLMVRGEWK